MSAGSRATVRWSLTAAAAVALLLAGAGITYLLMGGGANDSHRIANDPETGASAGAVERGTAASSVASAHAGQDAATGPSNAARADVVVTLTEDAVRRAGIEVMPVSAGTAHQTARIPGVVAPNAYRQVVVTPLVAGRITHVRAELGERVRAGQTMAAIFSPELADAQARYISARAELLAHERELQRTEKLVAIGAVSQQELERTHARHTAHETSVQSARSRLVLLGMSAAGIDALAPGAGITATTHVPAPIDGVVTERLANVGLNVDPGMSLFTVVDLSSLWIVGDLYEKDFARVRIGSPATITTAAYPDLVLRGRVSYIDPQVNAETRTARVRVEVRNRDRKLRLGMFVDMEVADAAETAVAVVPPTALQTVGDRHVVYVAQPDEPGHFIERTVQLGRASAHEVEVVDGVRPGDVVVTQGSFFVRAERDRMQPDARPAARPQDDHTSKSPSQAPGRAAENIQEVRVTVSARGFEPSRPAVKAGSPARLTFVRVTDETCATEVAFPALHIRQALPLNEPVTIELAPQQARTIAFACGTGMLKGTLVIQ